MNPLLSFEELPRFHEITAAHIEPAVTAVLSQNRDRLRQIIANEDNRTAPSWQSLMDPLDDMEDQLSKVWSTVSHLNAVRNTAEIREEYNKIQPLITEYYTELGQNKDLFAAVRRLSDRADSAQLGASERKILKDYLLDFQLAGVDLDDEKKSRFAALESQLSKLSTRFSNNVLDATMAWTRQVPDESLLSGLPETARQAALDAASRKNMEGYVLTLDAPCYISVMTNADNREVRREMYEAYVTRASDQGTHNPEWDNRAVIEEILTCRSELAQLLGYSSYAEVSVARKMAKSVGRVNEFLDDLVAMAVPAARREYQELCEFAAKEHGLKTLEAWDIPYYSEKLRKRNYDISQEELRPYFPVETVKRGLFAIANLIYGVEIRRNPAMTVWDDSVDAFDILRDGEVIARFYFDLFTRDGKKSGAWMAECRSRRQRADGSVQIPVAYLV
ncbi:MAG: M3 family metallopeptidase, partial [Pseudohongiellaceae bacterium]